MPVQSPRPIELLAPAKDLATALEAIAHGADAIYIGAPQFGARSAAGVSVEDIGQLCLRAHRFGVKVYVALNTILYDHEIEPARQLAWQLYEAGADALIIQDMGLTLVSLPPIALHASTQCDTCSPEDAAQLEAMGFEQIVLARELNLEQIRQVAQRISTPIEVFVHGALCVSYSGRCYLSQALSERSANRGACAQLCRLPYHLVDARGVYVRRDAHLLSLKDLHRADLLVDLLDAGVSSLKIEGRLKGISYVKNITSYYRQRIDEVIERFPDRYCRASYGRVQHRFVPDPSRSFNRGFTSYELRPKRAGHPSGQASLINPHSPKSQGQYLGLLVWSRGQRCRIDTSEVLVAGDGLLYVAPSGEVGGVAINGVEANRDLILARPCTIPRGSKIYRNYDQAFERKLSGATAERRCPVRMRLEAIEAGFRLSVRSLELPKIEASSELIWAHEEAKSFDEGRLLSELAKLGDTDFFAQETELDLGGRHLFIPLSMLSSLRREAIETFTHRWDEYHRSRPSAKTVQMPSIDRRSLPAKRPDWRPDYRANVANRFAREHYELMGYKQVQEAYELSAQEAAELMCTKHCLRYEIGYCTRRGRTAMPFVEPLYLEMVSDGRRLRLEFDCAACQMKIYKD